jgi:hypothetical protein
LTVLKYTSTNMLTTANRVLLCTSVNCQYTSWLIQAFDTQMTNGPHVRLSYTFFLPSVQLQVIQNFHDNPRTYASKENSSYTPPWINDDHCRFKNKEQLRRALVEQTTGEEARPPCMIVSRAQWWHLDERASEKQERWQAQNKCTIRVCLQGTRYTYDMADVNMHDVKYSVRPRRFCSRFLYPRLYRWL